METIKGLKRTRRCGEFTLADVGKTVTVMLDARIAPSSIENSAEGALAVIPAEIIKL